MFARIVAFLITVLMFFNIPIPGFLANWLPPDDGPALCDGCDYWVGNQRDVEVVWFAYDVDVTIVPPDGVEWTGPTAPAPSFTVNFRNVYFPDKYGSVRVYYTPIPGGGPTGQDLDAGVFGIQYVREQFCREDWPECYGETPIDCPYDYFEILKIEFYNFDKPCLTAAEGADPDFIHNWQ